MSTTLKPILDHIVVQLDPAETVLSSGIIITDSVATTSDRGTVLAVGPGYDDINGVRIAPDVNVGDKVLMTPGAGFTVTVNEVELQIVKNANITGVIPPVIDSAAELQPIGSNIVFRFLDEIGGVRRAFTDRKTAGGIIVSSIQNEQRDPRWGEVIAAGPESDVSPGEFIYIEGGMWTRGTKIAGEEIWRTESQYVIVTTTDPQDTI